MKKVMKFVRLDTAAAHMGADRPAFVRDFRTLTDRERALVAREVLRAVRQERKG